MRRTNANYKTLTPELRAQILELCDQRMNQKDIAARVGCCQSTVSRVYKEASVSWRPCQRGQRKTVSVTWHPCPECGQPSYGSEFCSAECKNEHEKINQAKTSDPIRLDTGVLYVTKQAWTYRDQDFCVHQRVEMNPEALLTQSMLQLKWIEKI